MENNLFSHVTLFDGAMGTMLQSSPMAESGMPLECLNITAPEEVEAAHRAYLEAGSDFISANTFGSDPMKMEETPYTAECVIQAGLQIARRAVADYPGRGVLLDIGPSGRAMYPVGDARFDDVYESFARRIRAGEKLCDAILLETFTDLLEAKAAVLAARENSNKPVFLSMSFQEDGRTFFGTPVEAAILTFERMGLSALGVNCSLGPLQLAPVVRTLIERSPLPVLVQPNAGLPVLRDGVSTWDITPEEFASAVSGFARSGAAIVGGCCGTTPEFIRLLKEKTGTMPVPPRQIRPLNGVCSATEVLEFGDFTVIGERLNPTGRDWMKKALKENSLDGIIAEAQRQADEGAQVLDINAGMPGIDEAETLTALIEELQGAVETPLQPDSADPVALESAVRHYAGKPLINSVNAKKESMDAVLPIASRYGAALVGLTLDENGLPRTCEERITMARLLIARAVQSGIPRRDIFIDCLTLTASAGQDQIIETLAAVKRVTHDLGVKTVLGVSNVSFGLPLRPLINRTFLTLALSSGLSAAIMNPGDRDMTDTLAAWRVLAGHDREGDAYIKYCAGRPADLPAGGTEVSVSLPLPSADAGKLPPLENAVLHGLKDGAASCATELLKEKAPMDVIEQHLIPALDRAGRDYEEHRIFLPQLIKSADAARSALDIVKKTLAERGGNKQPVTKIVIATVQGDVHDIGKNIVKVILENYNFSVIDLGRDVPPGKVVETLRSTGAGIAGLSALMTTTVAGMEETIRQIRANCPGVKIIVGGAVLTEELAREIGADAYAEGAMDTVRAAQKFTGH